MSLYGPHIPPSTQVNGRFNAPVRRQQYAVVKESVPRPEDAYVPDAPHPDASEAVASADGLSFKVHSHAQALQSQIEEQLKLKDANLSLFKQRVRLRVQDMEVTKRMEEDQRRTILESRTHELLTRQQLAADAHTRAFTAQQLALRDAALQTATSLQTEAARVLQQTSEAMALLDSFVVRPSAPPSPGRLHSVGNRLATTRSSPVSARPTSAITMSAALAAASSRDAATNATRDNSPYHSQQQQQHQQRYAISSVLSHSPSSHSTPSSFSSSSSSSSAATSYSAEPFWQRGLDPSLHYREDEAPRLQLMLRRKLMDEERRRAAQEIITTAITSAQVSVLGDTLPPHARIPFDLSLPRGALQGTVSTNTLNTTDSSARPSHLAPDQSQILPSNSRTDTISSSSNSIGSRVGEAARIAASIVAPDDVRRAQLAGLSYATSYSKTTHVPLRELQSPDPRLPYLLASSASLPPVPGGSAALLAAAATIGESGSTAGVMFTPAHELVPLGQAPSTSVGGGNGSSSDGSTSNTSASSSTRSDEYTVHATTESQTHQRAIELQGLVGTSGEAGEDYHDVFQARSAASAEAIARAVHVERQGPLGYRREIEEHTGGIVYTLPHKGILAEGSPWPEGTGAVRGVHVTGARGVDNVPVAVTHTVGRTRKAEDLASIPAGHIQSSSAAPRRPYSVPVFSPNPDLDPARMAPIVQAPKNMWK